ncbi:thermonuclease family protein [Microbacterium sp. NPDC076911]|uniref:thermonuclease family protein n=1 Tax=Microbacterium sp. NPDC076911 TaxID=3154958 RepID=UPI0034362D14
MINRSRRNARWGLFALAITMVLALGLLALSDSLGELGAADSSDESSASTSAGSILERPDDAFAMTVEYVTDGDTIKARANHSNEVITSAAPISVRLIGIDTPELRPEPECWSEEATEHLSALLPEGSIVWAAPDQEWYDHYDRALMYLWTESGDFINYELMAAGDARSLVVQPNDRYAELFALTEAQARATDSGQWGECEF